MKESARQIVDSIYNIFRSGNITELTFGKPVCNPSYFTKVAKSWGISIKKIPKNNRRFGYYNPRKNRINLVNNDKMVFYHELAHAGLHNFIYNLWEKPNTEIIAELTAQTLYVLSRGKTKNLWKSHLYITINSYKLKMSLYDAIVEVKEDVIMLIDVILTPAPIFELSAPDQEKPMYFKTQLEAEIFTMEYELKNTSIAVVTKDESTQLETDWSESPLLRKKGQRRWRNSLCAEAESSCHLD